jgi:TrmH family RNA methyltransferase
VASVSVSGVANRTITSSDNPFIKRLARMHSRRSRDASGRFLIEGSREVSRAITAGILIERVVFAPDTVGPHGRRTLELLDAATEKVEVPSSVFANLSRRKNHDGILVEAHIEKRSLDDLELKTPALVLVVESIEKPGNLGGMLRSADAAGVDAVVVANPATDLANPNVIRASQGSVFAVDTVAASTTATLEFLQVKRLAAIALTPDAGRELWDVDLTGDVAILVGSEDKGLSATFRASGIGARIPMAGAADSLNASVAAGISLYEAVRQRSS